MAAPQSNKQQQQRPQRRQAAHVLLLLLAVAGTALRSAAACTTILVGKGATTDGSMFLARTVDYAATGVASNNLLFHPARTEPLDWASSANSFKLTLPGNSLSYFGMPSTLVLGNPTLEEVGLNSAGVFVSATETISSSPMALRKDPLMTDTGVGEDHILSIILPQPNATSARAAVQMLGDFITRYGSSEGFGVLFADASESWYLENAAGHHWLAARVPDDSVFVSGNQARFQEVDLTNATAPDSLVLASPGLVDFATQNGLYDPASGRFNFFKAFQADAKVDASANYPRVRTLLGKLANFTYTPIDGFAPHFVANAGDKLAVGNIMAAMRDRFEGTDNDPYMAGTPAAFLDGTEGEPWRPVAILTTGIAHVTRVRPVSAEVPSALAVINYLAMGTPAWMPFIPLYAGLPSAAFPKEMMSVRSLAPDASLFWKGRRLASLIFRDFASLAPPVEAAVRKFDEEVEAAARPAMEQAYNAAIAAGNATDAEAQLVAFTADTVAKAVALVDDLTAKAVAALQLPRLPSDLELVPQLEQYVNQWAFGFQTLADLAATGRRLAATTGRKMK